MPLVILDGATPLENDGAPLQFPDTAFDDVDAAFRKTLRVRNPTAATITLNKVFCVGALTTTDVHPTNGALVNNGARIISGTPSPGTELDPAEFVDVVVELRTGPQYTADTTTIGDALFGLFVVQYDDGSPQVFTVKMVGATTADGAEAVVLADSDLTDVHCMEYEPWGSQTPSTANPRKLSPSILAAGHGGVVAGMTAKLDLGIRMFLPWMAFGQSPKPYGQTSVYGKLPRCAWQECQEDAAAQAAAFGGNHDHWFNTFVSEMTTFIADSRVLKVDFWTGAHSDGGTPSGDRTLQPILDAGISPDEFRRNQLLAISPILALGPKAGFVLDSAYNGIGAADPRLAFDVFLAALCAREGRDFATEPYRPVADQYTVAQGIPKKRVMSRHNAIRLDSLLYTDSSWSEGSGAVDEISIGNWSGEHSAAYADMIPWITAHALWRWRGKIKYIIGDWAAYITAEGPLTGVGGLGDKIRAILGVVAPGGASES